MVEFGIKKVIDVKSGIIVKFLKISVDIICCFFGVLVILWFFKVCIIIVVEDKVNFIFVIKVIFFERLSK